MRKYFIPILVLFFIVACTKNKYETRPTIKIKEINSTTIIPNSSLVITLEYTDKEGDLGMGQITYFRKRLNIKPIPNPSVNDKADTVNYSLPEFNNETKGLIEVSIPYDFLTEDPNDNDTMLFKIFVKDFKGNKSDTLTTSNIIAKQN
ncbi:MAG: hypothetical protein ACKVOW_02410 [Chitinophagaceae bacterium]